MYDKRKAEHKHKFNAGVPERKRMTMFDLIYYNPSEGHRMSNSSSRDSIQLNFNRMFNRVFNSVHLTVYG